MRSLPTEIRFNVYEVKDEGHGIVGPGKKLLSMTLPIKKLQWVEDDDASMSVREERLRKLLADHGLDVKFSPEGDGDWIGNVFLGTTEGPGIFVSVDSRHQKRYDAYSDWKTEQRIERDNKEMRRVINEVVGRRLSPSEMERFQMLMRDVTGYRPYELSGQRFMDAVYETHKVWQQR